MDSSKYLIVSFAVMLAAAAFAAPHFQPKVMQLSPEEIAMEEEIMATQAPMERVRIARSYLERYYDNVPLGRYASDLIRRHSDRKEDAVEYLREFAAMHPREIGPQYYYARIADDTLLWEKKARWAIEKDSTSNWAWLMWMAAEWHKSKPDMKLVTERVEKAVALDPSRPEGYFFLGDAYAEQNRWDDAIAAYEAGLVAEPGNGRLQLRLEDAKDRMRKSE